MRPIVVLILVLGAVTALVFALTSILGKESGSRGSITGTPVTARPPEQARTEPEIVEPSAQAERRPEVVEETRTEVVPQAEARVSSGTGTIEGTVVDQQKAPVAEARVSLVNKGNTAFDETIYLMKNQDPPRPIAKLVTDVTGTFRFEGLDPKKDWTIVVTHDKYMPHEAGPIPVPEEGVRREEIELEPGVTCSGTVRDAASGRGIPDALLVIDSPLAPFVSAAKRKQSQSRIEAKTDASGVYTFYNVGQGQNTLIVSAQGYATQIHHNFSLVTPGQLPVRFKNRQELPGIESKQQDFDLTPGMIIAGRVIRPDRTGVSGVEVEAISQTGATGSRGTGTSGDDGEFLIEDVAEGLYTVRTILEGYDSTALQRVEAGDTEVLIELFELGAVQGRVVDPSGHPISSFVCRARTANPANDAFGAIIAQKKFNNASNGAFELSGLQEGEYVIEANAQGYAPSFSEPFMAVQGVTTPDVVVRMSKGGAVRGQVVDSYGSTPIAGAEVQTLDNEWVDDQLFDLFSALEPTALTKVSVRTDAEGKFEIPLMTPGDYQIRIKAKDFTTSVVNDVKVDDGHTTDIGALRLLKGAVVRGKVHGPDGEITPGASVQLYSVDNTEIWSNLKTRADASGYFAISNVQAGTYKLAASRSNQNNASPFVGIVDLHNSEIEITVEDGGQYDFDLYLGARGEDR